jgi:hypothetical protein
VAQTDRGAVVRASVRSRIGTQTIRAGDVKNLLESFLAPGPAFDDPTVKRISKAYAHRLLHRAVCAFTAGVYQMGELHALS